MIIFFHQKGLTNRLKCAIMALKQEVTMQIRLNNGGKTSEFECAFKETEIIHILDIQPKAFLPGQTVSAIDLG